MSGCKIEKMKENVFYLLPDMIELDEYGMKFDCIALDAKGRLLCIDSKNFKLFKNDEWKSVRELAGRGEEK